MATLVNCKTQRDLGIYEKTQYINGLTSDLDEDEKQVVAQEEEERDYCQIAADIFGGDPGLLHFELIEELESIAYLVEKSGGQLRSREVIALTIWNWMQHHSDQEPYSYGG